MSRLLGKWGILPHVISLFISVSAWAWGDNGHRAVAKIAELHISKIAEQKISELMGTESLPRSATWPDEIKADPQFDSLSPYHYVTIPDGMDYESAPHAPEGDVVVGIRKMEATLRDAAKSKDEKVKALRLLVHFVGDVHQPFHVSSGSDRGGNDCQVKWHDKPTNLHAVWDSEMVNSTNLSFTEYVAFLDHATSEQIQQWQSSTLLDWVRESQEMRKSLYPANPETYCRKSSSATAGDIAVPSLGFKYSYQFLPILEKRILQGGIRLAGMLNSIFQMNP